MAVEIKRERSPRVRDLTDPELYYDKALAEARVLVKDAEDASIIALRTPAARSLLTHFVAPLILEEGSQTLKHEVEKWRPITALQVSDVLRNQAIQDAIDKSQTLAKDKLWENFQDICLISGISPKSEKAQELYEATSELARVLVGRNRPNNNSQN